MPMLPPITVEHIRRAARKLSQLRPVYADMLAFYEALFTCQEQAKCDIDLAPIRIAPEALAERRPKALPLVVMSELTIDGGVSQRLFDQLCELAAAHPTEMKTTARAVSRAAARGDLDPQILFQGLLQGDDAVFQETAARIGADPEALAFLAYQSIAPSIEICASQLAAYLKKKTLWQKGYCPVCGSAPGLVVLNMEGQRIVSCSFCRHQWQAPRIFCAFCENTKADELHYLFAEEENDLRVDTCDRCRAYIKTVDRRKVSRPLFPPLEQVASLHLDMIAAEKGYRSGTGLALDSANV